MKVTSPDLMNVWFRQENTLIVKFLKSYLEVKFTDRIINPTVIYLSKSIKTTMYSSRKREKTCEVGNKLTF